MRRLTRVCLAVIALSFFAMSCSSPASSSSLNPQQVLQSDQGLNDAMIVIGIPWHPEEDVELVGSPWYPESVTPQGTPWYPSEVDSVPQQEKEKRVEEHPPPANDGWKSFANLPCAMSAKFQLNAPRVYRWCGLITHYATKHGLPADFIAAVMLQESGGNPNAVSYCDAFGLMQIMPKDITKKTVACGAMKCGPGRNQHCFALRPSKEELRDPELNLAFGTKMLAGLVRNLGYRGALNSYFGSSGPAVGNLSYADIVLGHWERYGDGGKYDE